jgi:hypothetical protein
MKGRLGDPLFIYFKSIIHLFKDGRMVVTIKLIIKMTHPHHHLTVTKLTAVEREMSFAVAVVIIHSEFSLVP